MPRPALLFDLDGTLLHTDPLHEAVFAELLGRHGIAMRPGQYLASMHGRLNADIFAELMPDEDPDAMSDLKEAMFRDRLGRSAQPMPGASDLIGRARKAGWGIAVVTNAPRVNALAMLAAVGFEDCFDTLVIAEECARGKPHPDPYLTAMSRLDAARTDRSRSRTAPPGLASAHAAKIVTIGIRSSLDDPALRAAGADLSIADFKDPALAPYVNRL